MDRGGDRVAPSRRSGGGRTRLEELVAHSKFRAVRHLVHMEDDPHWLVREPRPRVGLAARGGRRRSRGPGRLPAPLRRRRRVGRPIPVLTIVVDHLGKPPLGGGSRRLGREDPRMRGEPERLREALGPEHVAGTPRLGRERLRTGGHVALDAFGPDRIMCGSDWPVALLNGDYDRVWQATVRLVEMLAPAARRRSPRRKRSAPLSTLGEWRMTE